METLEHLSGVWLHYFVLPPYTEREKNHLNIANNAFADGGNRTRATCAASECAIHYSIASRLHFLSVHLLDIVLTAVGVLVTSPALAQPSMVQTYHGLFPVIEISPEVKTSLGNKIQKCKTNYQYICCTWDCIKFCNNKKKLCYLKQFFLIFFSSYFLLFWSRSQIKLDWDLNPPPIKLCCKKIKPRIIRPVNKFDDHDGKQVLQTEWATIAASPVRFSLVRIEL